METAGESNSSCQGKRGKDEQQPCIEREWQHVSVYLLCLNFNLFAAFSSTHLNEYKTHWLGCVDRQKYKDIRVERRLDLTDTIKDGARVFLLDEGIRRKLLLALTEDSKLHIQEVCMYVCIFTIKKNDFNLRLWIMDK